MLRGLAAGGPRRAWSPDLPRAAATESVGVVFTGQVPVEQRCGGRASVESVGRNFLRVVVKGRSEMGRVGRRNRRQQRGERALEERVVLVVCWEREREEFTKERSLLVAQGL